MEAIIRRAWHLLACVVVCGVATAAHADPVLYSFKDNFGTANALVLLPDGVPTNVGSGIQFNGGVVYRPHSDEFFAIANDSSATATLYRFGLTSPASPLDQAVFAQPAYFGGLAYDPAADRLYAANYDGSGGGTLFGFNEFGDGDAAGVLMHTYSGIVFASGSLYGIAGNSSGNPVSFFQINPANAEEEFLFDLPIAGFGFNGLAFDNGSFYTIGNTDFVNSTLYLFNLSGPGSLAVVSPLEGVFLNAGIANATAVPLPAAFPFALSGLASLLTLCRRRRSSTRTR